MSPSLCGCHRFGNEPIVRFLKLDIAFADYIIEPLTGRFVVELYGSIPFLTQGIGQLYIVQGSVFQTSGVLVPAQPHPPQKSKSE